MLKKIIAACLFISSINAYAQTSSHLITAGDLGFLMQSLDNGKHWQNIKIDNHPPQGAWRFMGAACQGDFCLVADPSLLAQSKDGGKTWQAKDFPHLPNSQFYNTACSDKTCLVVGFQLIASTLDQGNTWQTVTPTNTNFLAATCLGQFCLVGGASAQPLTLGQSRDGGAHWTMLNAADIPNFTGPSQINAVTCSANFCAAAGYTGEHFNSIPLLLQTQDGGTTWRKVATPTQTGQFTSISCSGNFCVAAGTLAGVPYLFQTTNAGATWTRALSPDLVVAGSISSVSCTSQFCVAAGTNPNTNTPILVQTFDRGATWTSYQTDWDTSFNRLVSVSCSGATCIASGGQPMGPILWQTTNSGTTWSSVNLPPLNPGCCGSLNATAIGG